MCTVVWQVLSLCFVATAIIILAPGDAAGYGHLFMWPGVVLLSIALAATGLAVALRPM